MARTQGTPATRQEPDLWHAYNSYLGAASQTNTPGAAAGLVAEVLSEVIFQSDIGVHIRAGREHVCVGTGRNRAVRDAQSARDAAELLATGPRIMEVGAGPCADDDLAIRLAGAGIRFIAAVGSLETLYGVVLVASRHSAVTPGQIPLS